MPSSPIWPEYLPGLKIGWSLSKKSNVLRFEPERGPAKTRPLRSAEVMNIEGTLTYNDAQLDAFMKWHHEEIADGALIFNYHDFVSDNWVTARITDWKSEQVQVGEHSVSLSMEVFI
ncbi:hypothetical protein [uncultured Sphaerochaeta sp.]|uniref:hypothetical protein n=1 Tax=uncultured Sphaerochaeta sp. TaxID=886478 RepID=UPI002A0A0F7C|nr:hypothetical protein [uncultured Sphaerochaeta sp.]